MKIITWGAVARIMICAVILLVLAVETGRTAPPASGPGDQCAVMPEGPRIIGAGKKAYIWAAFHAKCKRNMLEVGAYACLMEQDYPEDPGRPVECSADRTRPYFTPDDQMIVMIATCEYTTIPRFYEVSGYGWAIFLPTDGGLSARSPDARSRPWKRVIRKGGSVRYCHISAKNMRWKQAK